jgi:uncharacterized protein
MSTARSVFLGPSELRAGWRLLIFFAIFAPFFYAAGKIVGVLTEKLHASPETPLAITIAMGTLLIGVLIASAIMAKIEHRSLAAYGLPWRRAFCSQFWQGAAFSFASLSLLVFVIHLAGGFSYGPLALHGADIVKYGIYWTLALFLGAVLEDFFYRGYQLFTLTTGIGFWPAAFVTSLWMGGMHYLNPGGHGLGPLAAFIYCMVTCLVIRRTGDLWMALGIHSGWAWGEVYLYGVLDSGFPGKGHLLNSSFHGPTWLTGGEFGMEASLPSLALLIIWGIIFSIWLRGVKYPNAAATPDRAPAQPQRPIGAASIITS